MEAERSCARAKSDEFKHVYATRACSPRINSNKAAYSSNCERSDVGEARDHASAYDVNEQKSRDRPSPRGHERQPPG